MVLSPAAFAQETICAKVKIEIKQELAFERQGFEAEMKISNSTDTSLLENISVDVKVADELGTPVSISTDPNDLSAKFFIRLAKKENIAAVDGTGTVAPRSTARIEWLLIPSPGAAGSSPLGKKYLVGATLRYRYNGEDTELNVSPGVITVKPVPLLRLDYFLPAEVEADDPLTPEIEPVVPFTLGVRVRNNGLATASNLKIDSAQPKIVENKQGLLIGFKLTGSYINDMPAQNTLIANFGDIPGNSAKMARWIMETTLSGKFTEFTASFSHADELGGALTSLVQATNAHVLVRDVKVDLPGRDAVRDFFARDGDILRIYESDGPDTEVTDQSALATLAPSGAGNGFTLNFPVTAGFVYVKLKDPFDGQKPIGTVQRSDAKVLPPENAWLSRTRNPSTKLWEYWVNFFDVNSTGSYTTGFKAPDVQPLPPVLQYIPDRTVKEGQQVSFLVEASSPNGRAVQLTAAPMPAGARLLAQAAMPQQPNVGRAVFDWTPPTGSKGAYTITYTATDGLLQATRDAKITVQQAGQTQLPGTPRIVSPLSGARLTQPIVRMASADLQTVALSAASSGLTSDTAATLQFELYADGGMTQQLATSSVAITNGQGTWLVDVSTLLPNTPYWWRVRSGDGLLFSPWVDAWFVANTGTNPPGAFNATLPSHGKEVGTTTPTLSWNHAVDPDQEALTYTVELCRDRVDNETIPTSNGMCNGGANQILVVTSPALQPGSMGMTSWVVQPPLVDGKKYDWRVMASDVSGARTSTALRSFTVNTANTAPSTPATVSPPADAVIDGTSATLSAQPAVDAHGDAPTYLFEIDTAQTFDSPNRRASPAVAASGGNLSWIAIHLVKGQRYWWRVKAQDGRAESGWAVSTFVVAADAVAPAAPVVRYPGQDAWVRSSQPSLAVSTAKPPEGRTLRYQFEVYYDAGLAQKLIDGSTDVPFWVVPKALDDLSTYWWRARVLDDRQVASDWSVVQRINVRLDSEQGQSVALTTPEWIVAPRSVANGTKRVVQLRWEVMNPGSDPTVALYYKPVSLPLPAGFDPRATFNGSLIVEGLKPATGRSGGTYEWDVSSFPPGPYVVYAVVYGNAGQGQSFAPGAVVVPMATLSGTFQLVKSSTTYESGTATWALLRTGATLKAPWNLLPADQGGDFVLPPLSVPAGSSSGSNQFTVYAPRQCFADSPWSGAAYVINSLDPNGHGRSSSVSPHITYLTSSNTNFDDVRLCRIRVLRETPVSDTDSNYLLTADLANAGAAFASATAVPVVGSPTATSTCPNVTAVQGELRFGAVGTKEVAHPEGTVAIRAPRSTSSTQWTRLVQVCGPLWNVTVTR
ncbi:hypothetical protein LXT13_07380 [Pelomonas sp. P8]|uniref:Fibronectin type-III domain-containing protein n=2 Tax=Pelomonas cellulosilytica TaxID=2906762 RepID=A0ABS8XSV6_9BURK|nr:hypothetical protein [Pelomonas sp. P8]